MEFFTNKTSNGSIVTYFTVTLTLFLFINKLSAQTQLIDADGDTKIQVEESVDEDIIRFDVGGNEQWIMQGARIEPVNTGNSIFIGDDAGLNDNLSNNQNVFIGNQSGYSNTIGSSNVFSGYQAGYSNTSGFSNAFIGRWAGYNNTTGSFNFFAGARTGYNNTEGNQNTFSGHQAGYSNTRGGNNTFLGFLTGFNNTTGSYNTCLGVTSGYANTTGYQNTFIGIASGYNNTSGNRNTFSGNEAGYYNTTGSYNTFSGHYAGKQNTIGEYNTFIGTEAGQANTSGNHNSFYGNGAGNANTTGSNNTFLGHSSGYYNTTGNNNIFLGDRAGYNNTAGIYNTFSGIRSGWANTTGNYNTFSGNQAGFKNTTGSYNSCFGLNTGYNNTTGHHNSFIGTAAGFNNTTGIYNTFSGHRAGLENTTGNYNTALGYNAGTNGTNWSNRTAIGHNSQNTASNQVRIGNSTVSSIGGYTNWSNISDARMKKNVKEEVAGLEFIMNLRPVTYQLDMNAIANQLNTPEEMRFPEAEASKGQLLQTGFIAQEVEKAAQDLGYEFSGIDAPKNENDLYGLRYAEFVVPLVKGMQEQQATILAQEQIIADQASQLENLQSKMDLIEQTLLSISNCCQGSSSPSTIKEQNFSHENGMQLSQNTPNPFKETTTITYQLDTPGQMSLRIYSEKGMLITTLVDAHQEKGMYKIKWEAANYPQGVYIYVLTQNGKELARKMMLID